MLYQILPEPGGTGPVEAAKTLYAQGSGHLGRRLQEVEVRPRFYIQVHGLQNSRTILQGLLT